MAGHTSIIHMNLEVNKKLFKTSHLGGGFFRLRDASFIPAGAAKIQVMIDGNHDVTDIFINEEIPAGARQRNYYTTKKALEKEALKTSETAVPDLSPA